MPESSTQTEIEIKQHKSPSIPALFTWATVVLISCAGAFLQLHAITAKSLWLDEGSSISMARLDWFNFLRILWRREMNMVLYYFALRGWLHLGDSVAWIRGLSVGFAVAAIPAIFLLARKMLGTTAGLVSALLLSVNAFQVRYAQEARSYSLLVLLVIASTYYLGCAIESNRRRDWNWYIATSCLAIYAHFFAVLVIVSHWLALRVTQAGGASSLPANTRTQFRRAAKWISIGTLPIWLFIATTGAGPIAWIRRPGLSDIIGLLKKLSGNAETVLLILYSACVVMGLCQGMVSRKQHRRDSTNYLILAAWLVVPLLIVVMVSLARPVFAPRYLIISMPAWIILASAGITAMKPRLLGAILTAAIVWFGIVGVRSYYEFDFDIGRNDVRSAAAYVLEHSHPRDGVIFYTVSARFPYDYYAAHTAAQNKPEILWPGSGPRLGWRDFMGVPSASRVPEFASGHDRIWLVTTPMPPNDPKFTAFAAALNQQYRLTETQEFPYIQVMLFSRH